MAEVSRPTGSLFNRLRLLRRTLPPACSLAGIGYEIIEHGVLLQHVPVMAIAGEILFYSIIGPLLIYAMLTWLLRRVAERDAAEARLALLYEVGRQTADAQSLDELQEIALSVPDRAGVLRASCALIVQEGPERPWMLARTRGFSPADVEALQAALATSADYAGGVPDAVGSSYLKTHCPLLRALSDQLSDPWRLAFVLSLSREPSRRAVMGIYVPPGSILPLGAAETLEPLAAGLALALDRATVRMQQEQLLEQVQQSIVAHQLGIGPTFERILADIAAEHPVAASAVYLLRTDGREQLLACAACWPDPSVREVLAESALAVIRTRGKSRLTRLDPIASLEQGAQDRVVLALPITSEGEALGVLVLAGRAPARLPHQRTLDVVTSMMALLIRNSQLYGRLESQAVLEERNHLAREVHDGVAQALGFYNVKVQQVQRLLSRGDLAGATAALQELRAGSQEVYDEVRRMIQDLSGPVEHRDDLAGLLNEYCSAFAARTGLKVSVEAGAKTRLSMEVQDQLFRVVQEALNNVQRHAQAQNVCVRLGQTPDYTLLTVEDDGAGMRQEPAGSDHFGLRIMRKRVQSLGGELEFGNSNGKGTLVDVRIPTSTSGLSRREELWNVLVS